MLGLMLAHTGDSQKFLDWNSKVPETANQDARTWFARAAWATRLEDDPVAARCLWECLSRDPNHLAANTQLAQSLDRLGQSVASTRFRQRGQQLSELVTLLRGLAGDPRFSEARTEQRLRRVVELNQELGRAWEAAAWSMVALRNNQVKDIAALGNMTELRYTFLEGNKVTDLGPLVAMAQKDAKGDRRFAPYWNLYVAGNPLSDAAKGGQIAALKKVGVRVDPKPKK